MSFIEEIKKIKSGKKELREFGLTVGGILGSLVLIAWWKGKTHPILAAISVLLMVLGVGKPFWLTPFQKVWMALGLALGLVMTPVIVGLLFFAILTPVALIARLIGKRFLNLKFREDCGTYWIPRKKEVSDKTYYEKQF